ncbi:MAG: isochorismate synthase [Verrucomicrobiae bacterium]|nr:isochorismate synthase [Verrucomicrobiae bacterium]
MDHFPIENYGGQESPVGLIAFLEDCRQRAQDLGQPQLVNISLDVFHIDPLAILEAVFEPDNHHFYLENPAAENAISAIEKVLETTASGSGRFQAIKSWASEVLDSTIYTGNTVSPYCGIHFFCSFNFFDEGQDVPGFPAAQAFVPVWQVSKKNEFSLAIANCMIAGDTPIEYVAKRIMGAHQRFSGFPFQSEAHSGKGVPFSWIHESECGEAGHFENAVAKATSAIERGDFEKIVLARAVDFEGQENLSPLLLLDRLRNRFPSCHTFSYSAGSEGAFLGSTPELLVRVQAGRLRADALAGSIGRGASAGEDAALGGSLLKSDKDAREHRAVVRSIVNRLQELNLKPEVASKPRLLKLPNLQHLYTPIDASLPDDVHILDVIERLHPTSAVGGSPRSVACPRIPEYEAFPRGPYAGPVGWFDARGDGEFVVGIRSGIIRGNRMRLFSGSGIVKGSVPGKEKEETDLKFKAMRGVMV